MKRAPIPRGVPLRYAAHGVHGEHGRGLVLPMPVWHCNLAPHLGRARMECEDARISRAYSTTRWAQA
eukprot:1694454-Pyramimonas_sp.AAC.1